MCIAACGITAIEGDAMRLINNGAICAVKSKEQRRLERFRAAQSRKSKMKGAKKMESKFVVCSENVCEYFSDVESARKFAEKTAKETGEDISIYLRHGTMCGRIDLVSAKQKGAEQ